MTERSQVGGKASPLVPPNIVCWKNEVKNETEYPQPWHANEICETFNVCDLPFKIKPNLNKYPDRQYILHQSKLRFSCIHKYKHGSHHPINSQSLEKFSLYTGKLGTSMEFLKIHHVPLLNSYKSIEKKMKI